MSEMTASERSAAEDASPEEIRRRRAAEEPPRLPRRLYYAVKAAEVVAIILAIVTIGVGWWQYSTNLDNDRTKAASGYFTDYLKLIRELEVEERAAAERLRDWHEKLQERNLEQLQKAVATAQSSTPPTTANSAAGVNRVASSEAPPAQVDRTHFMPAMPSTSENTSSYIMHLAESIFVLQRDDDGWRHTVTAMVKDYRDAIERIKWHCRAMDRGFLLLLGQHAQLTIKCDDN